MTTFTVQLSDSRTCQITADDLTSRNDGSLWFLRAAAPPPDKLAVVAILARGEWRTVLAEGAPVLFLDAPRQPATLEKPERTPRFA